MNISLDDNLHRQRILILLLWVLCTLWVRPWTGDLRSDTLTYACVAKEMVQTQNWLSPTLEGQPFLNKPPLYFWLVALSFKLFGFSVYAAKLPSLIFAIIDVLFFYFIVYRFTENKDLAFFSAFAFETTRWIIRNIAANRPESLLVFSLLLGWFALILMEKEDKRGPYLLGISVAVAALSKIFFALFIPLFALCYGLVLKRISRWLKWQHFYYGCILGFVLSISWFIYFETVHPGYLSYLINEQTLGRIAEGTDVQKNKLMYLKEIALYYHPHLIFFLVGFFLLVKRIRDQKSRLILLAVILFYLPLQLSEGKSDRYLTMVTPFFSFVTATGIVHFEKIKKYAKGFALYGIIPVFLFFWIIPVKVRAEKFLAVHVAERLTKIGTTTYQDPLYSFKQVKNKEHENLLFAEWSSTLPDEDQRFSYYFFLSESFVRWDDSRFTKWVEEDHRPVLLITYPKSVESLPQDGVQWTEIYSDKYHVLFLGIKK